MNTVAISFVIGIVTFGLVIFAIRAGRSQGTRVAGVAAGGLDVPEPRPLVRGPDISDVGRRKFFLRALGFAFLAGLGQFALVSIDFLYPRLRGGFGTKLAVGEAERLRSAMANEPEPRFIADGRFYLTLYRGSPEEAEAIPAYVRANVGTTGFMALYRKCVHLGCSVPWCATSKWYECPCHGSKYSVNGEYRDGPAPRSLDLFPIEIVEGQVIVDTSSIVLGAPRGTVTAQPQPQGPHCVSAGE